MTNPRLRPRLRPRLSHRRTRFAAIGGLIAAQCLALAALSGCASEKTSDRDLELVSVADAPGMVSPSDGVLGVGGNSGGVYVDPRTESAYEAGHIPGALSMPFQHVRRDWELLLKYDTVIVYGDDYNDPKARGMSKRLLELGLDNVYTLRGGLVAWKNAGLSLEEGSPADE